VMRLHGYRLPETPITHADGRPNCPTGGGNEVWSFGEEVYQILSTYLRLRERMRPYVRDLMRQAHEHGDPVMRPMFYGYPGDERSWTVDDQFLFGPDLLVAPVVQPGAQEREVHLPAGATWTELHSGRSFDGGQTVTVDAALAVIPVFARGNTQRELLGAI
jgi:alpha-D-xyloside xylohydrolase